METTKEYIEHRENEHSQNENYLENTLKIVKKEREGARANPPATPEPDSLPPAQITQPG